MTVGALTLALLTLPASASAQGKGKDDKDDRKDKRSTTKAKATTAKPRGLAKSQGIPPGHLPPPGQCRVWVDGTPPGQQAEPTDCRSAMQRAADIEGARVVVGRGTGVRRGGMVSCANRRASYPVSAPLMRWGTISMGTTRARALRQWNLPADATAAVNDFNHDGRPETVVWNSGGRPVQIWHNPDGDGSADVVEIFCNGTEVQEFVY
jgi:hypothetical protein